MPFYSYALDLQNLEFMGSSSCFSGVAPASCSSCSLSVCGRKERP